MRSKLEPLTITYCCHGGSGKNTKNDSLHIAGRYLSASGTDSAIVDHAQHVEPRKGIGVVGGGFGKTRFYQAKPGFTPHA